MVEPQPSKLMVRVRFPPPAPVDVFGSCSSGVEHTLGKGEVDGSIPSMSSILQIKRAKLAFFVSAFGWVFVTLERKEGVVRCGILRYHGARCCIGGRKDAC